MEALDREYDTWPIVLESDIAPAELPYFADREVAISRLPNP